LCGNELVILLRKLVLGHCVVYPQRCFLLYHQKFDQFRNHLSIT